MKQLKPKQNKIFVGAESAGENYQEYSFSPRGKIDNIYLIFPAEGVVWEKLVCSKSFLRPILGY